MEDKPPKKRYVGKESEEMEEGCSMCVSGRGLNDGEKRREESM